jgi:hypothetical protein
MSRAATAQKKVVNVVQDPEAPVESEVLADAIVAVSDAAKKLLNGPLKKRAIITLIKDYSPQVSRADIESVLEAAADLATFYVKS